MSNYIILTDSSCDLPAELAQEFELSVLPLSVYVDDQKYVNYLDHSDISCGDFYQKLRSGCRVSTSAANFSEFESVIEPFLQRGDDVIYMGFSSALSGTLSAGATACAELQIKYPQRKIFAVDTLCASLGQGLLVYLAAQKKKAGATIEEVRDFVEAKKLNLCHWFTVDDLYHLKRGGRVSAATAVIGSLLSIKPVLHVDNFGRLINVDKARGRKASIAALVDRMESSAIDPKNQTIFISHGDCLDDANYLADMIRSKFKVKDILINYVGPVIGAHSGPGTLALFFLGSER